MKNKFTQILTSIFIIVSSIIVYLISSSTSMEKNAIIYGFSLPRLLMLFCIIFCVFVYITALIVFATRPAWLEKFYRFLQSAHRIIYITTLCLCFVLLAIFALIIAALSDMMFLGSIGFFLQRGVFFIAWLLILGLQLLIIIRLYFKDLILTSENWDVAFKEVNNFIKTIHPLFWFIPLAAFLTIGVYLAISPVFSGQMPQNDSGIFLYFGSRILKGDIPYKNLWDHKPPLIFYIDALGLFISNRSIWGVWALEVMSLFASVLLLYGVFRKNVSMPALLLALVGLITNIVFPNEGGNFTEEFGIPFQCIALFLFCHFMVMDKKKPWRWFLIGGAMGMALMLKQTLIGIWAALLIISAYKFLTKDRTIHLADFFWFLGGLVLVQGACILYFYINHSLWEFWDVAYRFNFLYSDITTQDRIEAVGSIFRVFLTASWFYYFGLVIWAAFVRRGIDYVRKLPVILLVALVDFPIEIILISLSGKNYHHYFFTLLPCFAILIGYGWEYAHKPISNHSLKFIIYMIALIMIVYKPIIQLIKEYQQPPEIAVTKVVQYIKSTTKQGDYVLLWGSQTVINFMSGRDAPTRFVHQKPLYRIGYASPELSQEMLNDLKTKPPKIIINTYLPSTPFIEINHSGQCIMPEKPLPDDMFEVLNYICMNYDIAGEIGKDHWKIYKLKN